MDLVNLSVSWARGEVFASMIMGLVGVLVLLGSGAVYLWGKSQEAQAYALPLLGAGLFLVVCWAGLFFANKPRISSFPEQYKANPEAFLEGELARTEKSDRDLRLVVFRVLPCIIAVSAVAVMFVSHPSGRAWLIVLILLCSFLMAYDSQTTARNARYREQLLQL